jgi:DNA-binding IclR family transcriptional regulator
MLDICLCPERRYDPHGSAGNADVPAVASPAASRAAQVLKVLAAAREPDLSLSEVARRVGVNRASCQTLLLALVGEGLVTRREPGPTYRLGPALIHLGEAARASVDVAVLAEPHLVALQRRFGVTTMAGMVTGTDILVAAVHEPVHPFGLTVVPGGRLPLRAPIGPIYVAWADDTTVDAWLDRAAPPLGRTRRARARRDLAEIRERGYSVTVRGSRRPLAAIDHEELTAARGADAALRVVGISAAVWDAAGALACSIALTGFSGDMSRAEIIEVGHAVRDAAQSVTGMCGGRPPSREDEA